MSLKDLLGVSFWINSFPHSVSVFCVLLNDSKIGIVVNNTVVSRLVCTRNNHMQFACCPDLLKYEHDKGIEDVSLFNLSKIH